ncbi:DnaJ-domain-containing protein [Neocallimastix sp. 'constans']
MDVTKKVSSNYEKGRARIEQILRERSLYRILGVESDATTEEIRKSYLRTSRLIHPDKFHNDEDATRAFQMAAAAYETLKNPTLRRQYDLIGKLGNEDGSEASFTNILTQILNEMFNGNFDDIMETMEFLTNCEINRDYHEVQDYLVIGKKCWTAAKGELKQIYQLQCKLRTLSYFDVLGRLELALELTEIFLSLPIIIHTAGSANINKRLLNLLNQLVIALNYSEKGVTTIDNWLKEKWGVIVKITNSAKKEKQD